jgi:hypothetical protein
MQRTCLRLLTLMKAIKFDLDTSAWVAAAKYRLRGNTDLGPPMSSLRTSKLQVRAMR